MRLRLAFAIAALSAAFCACKTEKDEAARAEAGRVAHQVDQLRDAPNAAKPPFLKELEQLACVTPDVCALKQACVDAYTVQKHALDAIASVRHAAEQTGSEIPEGAALVLSQAEAELARARALATQCADKEAAARRSYGL